MAACDVATDPSISKTPIQVRKAFMNHHTMPLDHPHSAYVQLPFDAEARCLLLSIVVAEHGPDGPQHVRPLG